MENRTMVDPNYSRAILHGFKKLRNDNMMLDYTLVAENVAFRVHKILLASVSDYFKAVFRSGMLEEYRDMLHLKGITSQGLAVVVDYMYRGSLILNTANIVDVLETAAHLQISPMLELCCQFLIGEINMENVKDMETLATTYYLLDLHRAVTDYVLENFPSFSKTEYFKQLPLSEVCKLLKHNKLKCQSEFRLFKQILNEWVFYARDSREMLLTNLLQHIRLPFMSKGELFQMERLCTVRKDKNCRSLIERAIHFKENPREQVLTEGSWTKVRNDPHIITFGCSNNAMHSCILYKDEWRHLNNALSQPRPFLHAAATVVNNYLFVCGGCHLLATDSCICFNPVAGKWTPLAPLNRPRRNFALTSLKHHLYAIGGLHENDEVTNSVEIYSIKNNSWTYGAPLATPVADVEACSYGDTIYAAGGVDENFIHVKEFRSYSLASKTWVPKANLLSIKFSPKMFAKDGRIYIMDLFRTEGACAQLDIYDIATNKWSSKPLEGVQFTRTFGAAMIDDWIYFVGRNDVDDGRSKRYNVQTGDLQDIKAYVWDVEGPLCCTLQLPRKLLLRKMLKD